MSKNIKRLLGVLLTVVMVLSLFPSTAFAASSVTITVQHQLSSDCDWAQVTGSSNKWTKDVNPKTHFSPAYGTKITSVTDSIDLWVTSESMTADEKTAKNCIPYFTFKDESTEASKEARLKLDYVAVYESGNPENKQTILSTDSADSIEWTTEKLKNLSGKWILTYYWCEDIGSNEPAAEKYSVHYSFDRSNQGWSSAVKINRTGSGASNVELGDNSLKNNVKLPEDKVDYAGKAVEGNEFVVDPARNNTEAIYTYSYTAHSSTDYYELTGWLCEGNSKLYQIGDTLTASAEMAKDGIISFKAQWKKVEGLAEEELAAAIAACGAPVSPIANVNGSQGETVRITSDTADELLKVGGEVNYTASAEMAQWVVMGLTMTASGITDPEFAQFQINLAADRRLELVDEDNDGWVEFTFTCPFLRPTGKVLVGDTWEAMNPIAEGDVQVATEESPYTYKVSASALTGEDGRILNISLPVEWRPTKEGYSESQLSAKMTLTAPTMRTTDKSVKQNPLDTSGFVTGWIDLEKGKTWPTGLTEENVSLVAEQMLNASPAWKSYLSGKHELTGAVAAVVMRQYMRSETAKEKALDLVAGAEAMEKNDGSVTSPGGLSANHVSAYYPCIVTFVNGDDTIDTQYIKYRNPAEQTDKLPAYSGGMDFDGWYIQGTDTKFDFTIDMVTDDMVLEARWSNHNHDWSEWTVTREPTCVAGERSHTCSICGRVETEAMAAVDPHTPGEAWEQDGTNHWHLCTRCNAPVDIAAHSYPDTWTVRTPATVLDEGLEFHNCTVCNREETRTIDRLPNTPVIPAPTPTPVTPNTPTPTPTPAPSTTIVDEDVPLANVTGLDNTDHFAYIKGYEDGTVRPMKNITRAEVATIFFRLMTDDYRAANWSTTNSFTDVAADAWYNTAISTAAQAGILKGYTDGSVKPDKDITRAEFATIAARFISADITDDGTGDFSDTVGHWAAKEIRLAVKAGWIKGDGNRFRPDESINRAEVMTMVNRMLDRVPDVDHMLPGMKTWSDNPVGTWYYAAVQEATNDHHHERAEDGVTEIWTELAEEKDWDALMAEWIANGGRSAASMEAQRPSWLMS